MYRLGTSVGLYCNAGTVGGISSPFVLENSGSQVGMMVSDTDRHVATFDFSKARSGSSIARADGTVQWTGGPAAATTGTATHPLVLFGTATANGTHGTVDSRPERTACDRVDLRRFVDRRDDRAVCRFNNGTPERPDPAVSRIADGRGRPGVPPDRVCAHHRADVIGRAAIEKRRAA